MKVSIHFQYLPDENQRPSDGADNSEPIEAQDGQFLPIPDVGDTVQYQRLEASGEEVTVFRMVKTKHYGYNPIGVWVNLVVVDVPRGEMPMRLKE